MATSQAGIDAAYATEINNCEFRDDAGVRFRSRPQSFCDSVSMSTTLSVTGTATFASPISVAQAVVVNGISYSPGILTVAGAGVSILTAGGAAITVPGVPPSPDPYVLPPATVSTLGGVIVGTGLTVAGDGTLSANPGAIVPATTSTLGGIIVGNGLNVTGDGTLSANAEPIVPATTSTLGGIIVGDGLDITSNGTLSANVDLSAYVTLATAQSISGQKTFTSSVIAPRFTGRVSASVISSAPPTTPVQGDLWWDNDVGMMFVYYNDGDSQQWVSTISQQQISTSAIQCNNISVTNSADFNNVTITGTATGVFDAGSY